MIYPPTATRVQTTVRSVSSSGVVQDQPAFDTHYHCLYLATLGSSGGGHGFWIDGDYHAFEWEDADDGEGRKAAVPFNGVVREYVLGDGSQGSALRRHTADLEPPTRRWLESDRFEGYSAYYVRFIAKAAGATRDPDTGELVQASLLPLIDLDRWPLIEWDIDGRNVLIPSSGDASEWVEGQTNEFWANLYDRLRLMGWDSHVNAQSFYDAHRIGAVEIQLNLPPEDTNRGQLRWMQAAERPATPVTFDPGAGWQSDQPTEDAADGMSWWMIVRVGMTQATFQYWTDPQVWVRPRSATSPEGGQGNQGLSVTRSASEGGMGPDIDIPPIGGPDDDDMVVINPPPPGQGEDDPNVDDRYRGMFTEEEQRTIRYPISEASTLEDHDEQGLADFMHRTALNHHGRLVWKNGEIHAVPGYAAPPVADLHDGRDIEITNFESSDPARQQWNSFAMTMTQAGSDASDRKIIEINDSARIMREGRKVRLDIGRQDHFANRLNGTMAVVKGAIRRRYQRHGGFTIPPDTDLKWRRKIEAGNRVRLHSDRHDLESYRLGRVDLSGRYINDGKIRRLEYTTALLTSVVELSDRSLQCQWYEDPDIIWHDWLTFPGLDPDVGAAGLFVEAPRNLTVTEHFRAQGAGHLHYLSAAFDATAAPKAIVQWRPVIPEGETLELDGETIRVTPDWGELSQTFDLTKAQVDFGSGTLAIGFEYEVRVAFVTTLGVQSEWAHATIRIGGATIGPVDNLAVDEFAFRFAGTVYIFIRATFDDDDSGIPVRLFNRLVALPAGAQVPEVLGRWQSGPFDWPYVHPVAIGARYEVQAQRGYDEQLVGARSGSVFRTVGGDLTPPDDPTDLALAGIQGGYSARWTDPRVFEPDADQDAKNAALSSDVATWHCYHAEAAADGSFPDNPPAGSYVGKTTDPWFIYDTLSEAKRLKFWVRAFDESGNASDWISGVVDTLRKGSGVGAVVRSLTPSLYVGSFRVDWGLPVGEVPEFWKLQLGLPDTSNASLINWGTAVYVAGTESSYVYPDEQISSAVRAALVGKVVHCRIQAAVRVGGPGTGPIDSTTDDVGVGGAVVELASVIGGAGVGAPSLTAVRGNGRVVVSWPAVESATFYEGRWREADGEWSQWAVITSPWTVGNLTNGTEHDFQVRSGRTVNGETTYSNAALISSTPASTGGPGPGPGGATTVQVTVEASPNPADPGDTVTITATATVQNGVGATAFAFSVGGTIGPTGSSFTPSLSGTGNSRSFVAPSNDLPGALSTTIQVEATNNGVSATASVSVTVRSSVVLPDPPPAPASVGGTATQASIGASIESTVSWGASAGATEYFLQRYGGSGVGWRGVYIGAGTSTSHTIPVPDGFDADDHVLTYRVQASKPSGVQGVPPRTSGWTQGSVTVTRTNA